MSDFYLDQHAINFLTQLILTSVITLYLFSLKNKTAVTRWFILFFCCLTLYAGSSFAAATSLWTRRFYGVFFQLIALSGGIVALIQFAYRFPHLPGKPDLPRSQQREAKILLLISGAS